MPPAQEPIDTQIIDAVVDLINTGLNATDYYFSSIPTVSKEEDNIFDVTDFPAVFVIQDDLILEEQVGAGPGGYYTVFMDVIFIGMLQTHENAQRDIARLRADLFKLLSIDQQLGGKVIDSTLKRSNSVLVQADFPLQYTELTATYQFRMFKDDPTLDGC